jgi:predicted phosphoribosyltransferase
VLNPDVVELLQIPASLIDTVVGRELQEIERRERGYRARRPAVEVQGRTLILVDDGLATGATMRAAVTALRRRRPARVVVAVPTAAPEACADLRTEVDEVVCAHTPEPFYAVGLWYDDFTQVSDDEVRDLLAAAARGHDTAAPVHA